MAIQNPNHVKGVRDAVHAGIQEFAKDHGLDVGGLAASDVVCAVAWVLRDLIKEAPDAYVRAELAAGARYAIDDAGKSSILLPGMMN